MLTLRENSIAEITAFRTTELFPVLWAARPTTNVSALGDQLIEPAEPWV